LPALPPVEGSVKWDLAMTADFYYGEMEMRHHAHTTPAAERAIIWLYWLISGIAPL